MKIRLHKLFTQLKREYPDIPAHAKILGCGYFSIVIDNRDGTLTKAFVRHRNRFGSLSWDRKIFENEVRTLEMLNGSLLGNVATPKLVQEPVILNHGSKRGDFLGLLRMTKLEGRSASWWTLAETGTPLEKKNHFEQVGALMAHFHAATQNFTKSKMFHLKPLKLKAEKTPPLPYRIVFMPS